MPGATGGKGKSIAGSVSLSGDYYRRGMFKARKDRSTEKKSKIKKRAS